MNLYVSFKFNHLPKMKKMIGIMYFPGADYSWVGNDTDLRCGEGVQFCWNKWVDDTRWSGRDDSNTYINARLIDKSILHIQSDEQDIPIVDQRAIAEFVRYLLEIDNHNTWSLDQSDWKNKNQFLDEFKMFKFSFEDAVEMSLKGEQH
jgi:hypothetical protein